jgi:phosphoglycerate dehydrogenase-like enzyme
MNETIQLFQQSDYVVVAAPLTDETKGMIGEKEFAHSKQNQVLINIGRGPVVDENALIFALKTGVLRGAALDVFNEEPLPTQSELWALENILLSPHNADMTFEFRHRSVDNFVRNCELYLLRGRNGLSGVVDTKSGY